jgi:hypothetical protein
MNKLILTVLMVVMLATPCIAEVEPAGLFTIDNTQWYATASSTAFYPDITMGFSDGLYPGYYFEVCHTA